MENDNKFNNTPNTNAQILKHHVNHFEKAMDDIVKKVDVTLNEINEIANDKNVKNSICDFVESSQTDDILEIISNMLHEVAYINETGIPELLDLFCKMHNTAKYVIEDMSTVVKSAVSTSLSLSNSNILKQCGEKIVLYANAVEALKDLENIYSVLRTEYQFFNTKFEIAYTVFDQIDDYGETGKVCKAAKEIIKMLQSDLTVASELCNIAAKSISMSSVILDTANDMIKFAANIDKLLNIAK